MDNIILTLLCIPNVGRKTVLYLIESIEKFPINESELLEIFISSKLTNKKIYIPTLDEIKKAKEKSNDIILNSSILNIKYIDILNEKFPKSLKQIKDKPVMLFYKGNYKCIEDQKTINIIGSRKASINGLKEAYKLGYDFGKDKYCVVSGLAIGCDEQAHKGCLDANGNTVAVLPSAIDKIYPYKNNYLAEKIIENKGCLISEYPIGKNISKNQFIERDRIQSGISKSVLLCESSLKSGSMHTIEFAKLQGKIISCIDINADGNEAIKKDKRCVIIRNEKDIKELKNKINNFKSCENMITNNIQRQIKFEL
ncbi:DNA-processing protein DprA [Romboutsia lituseburensis]|uniref:DNA-processing protein DprA n=1 Tax=Romboutsia lituseburensis TaxID=1537 RepID=UPI00215B2317|nr:DNA-protecting protein DprA [Romboutsia lituseburensis]MCR8743814.1 DNA-protecting protein DprA [Romboutsia lituseburensis]